MYYEPYTTEALHTAYCHRLFLHAQTHRRLPQPALEHLRRHDFQATLEPYNIHLLDVAVDNTDLVCQLSLTSDEAVSTAASKFKGRLSKWLRTAQGFTAPRKLLGKGYLAYTVGDTTTAAVTGYLSKQARKHGYAERPLPPSLVETYPPADADCARLSAAHSVGLLRYHLVFGTMYRKGIFTQTEARRILSVWRELEEAGQFCLLKASFVPDHVHVAIRLHPAVRPLSLAVDLMNAGQTVMFEEFPEIMIRYGSDRLWENGAYVGSFGNVNSRAIRQAIACWRQADRIDWPHGIKPWSQGSS